VDIDLALQDPEANFSKHLEHYDEWIQSGFAGKMEYLIRGRDRRADPRLVFPQAQSIFCVALPYSNQPAGASTLDQGPRYARYLQGPDYHLEIAERLEAVMRSVQDQWQKSPTTPELQWKVCVDSSAILERTWAALAGLGWIGKNTLLIHPHYGSYLFLAEVLINQPTGQGPHLVPNYCGHCTRCLSSCPTGALIQPGTLDSNQCIAYWTLEKRGDLEISASQKGKIKNWIAGCDLCQEACPFNRKPAQRAALSLLKTNQGQENATLLNHWIDLLNEIPSDYRLRVKNSALNRVKPAQFSRNLAITLTNTLTEMPPDLGTQLKALLPLIIQRENQETDAIAKQEWENCVRLIKNHSEKCL
jgi:epoxyqueuosine reductase